MTAFNKIAAGLEEALEVSRGNVCIGQKFSYATVEQFQRINNEANERQLMAKITAIQDAEDGRRISFELIARSVN